MSALTQINGYIRFLSELVRYEGEWNKHHIESLLYPEVRERFDNVDKATYREVRCIWESDCASAYEEQQADIGVHTSFKVEITQLDEALEALTNKYQSEHGIYKPVEIAMMLNTELVGLGLYRAEVTYSNVCEVWFDSCEEIFLNRFGNNTPPPAAPALRIAA